MMGHGRRQILWRHIAADRRMDGKTAHGSTRLGTGSPLSDPRSGRGLWWRERLALDQRPRGERIDRGWARAGAAEQLIGADRGCQQRHDRPDRSQNPPASRSSPQVFAEAQKKVLEIVI